MLRAHALDGHRVVTVAKEFGFSRETYYLTLAAFSEMGVLGLALSRRAGTSFLASGGAWALVLGQVLTVIRTRTFLDLRRNLARVLGDQRVGGEQHHPRRRRAQHCGDLSWPQRAVSSAVSHIAIFSYTELEARCPCRRSVQKSTFLRDRQQ